MAFSILRRVSSFQPFGNMVRTVHFKPFNPDLNLDAFGKTLEEDLKEKSYKDPAIYYKVDIGLPSDKLFKQRDARTERLNLLKKTRSDENSEKSSRHGKLEVPLQEVSKDWLKEGRGQEQIKSIAQHYGVFEHLFGDAYFYPRVPLNIAYHQGEDIFAPVYFGNQLKPKEVQLEPTVEFESDPDTLWTLVLTNPDGHLTKDNSEYVHWMIGNIPGTDVLKGEMVYDYLPPFPPKGVGFHRMIFVLYKQDAKVDFSKLKKSLPCTNLEERTFSTYDFYKERQDFITPAGLAFFQTDWDPSVKKFFHNYLSMEEPIFEYDFPEPFVEKQVGFPIGEPFNIYLDKHRDPKDINRDYLLDRLKKENPFMKPKPKLRFPNAEPIPRGTPSWLADKMRKDRLGWGRINEVEEYDGPPTDSLHTGNDMLK